MSDQELCLYHYRIMFPTLASLGTVENPISVWNAEYMRLASGGLSATLVIAHGADGSSANAVRNFDQKLLLSALITRRSELDTEWGGAIFKPTYQKQRFTSIIKFNN